MDNYLLDRETLGKFIDELMKQRPLPIEDAGGLSQFRENQMKALDDHITQAIFGNMSEAQAGELEQLLDTETEDPGVFRNFFRDQGIDIENIITNAAASFSAEFLKGGQNA